MDHRKPLRAQSAGYEGLGKVAPDIVGSQIAHRELPEVDDTGIESVEGFIPDKIGGEGGSKFT